MDWARMLAYITGTVDQELCIASPVASSAIPKINIQLIQIAYSLTSRI
jgi:hypothetical protein